MVVRLYHPGPLQQANDLVLTSTMSHRLFRVMRLNVGEQIEVFDGLGQGFEATLLSKTSCRLLQPVVAKPRLEGRLTLAFGLCAPQKMEWVVQKATELAIDVLQPMRCMHSSSNHASSRYLSREDRLIKIIQQACEQSGRMDLPTLLPPKSLDDTLAEVEEEARVIFFDQHNTPKIHTLPIKTPCHLLVGPEGGFSDEEIGLLQAHRKATPISLGPLTLRSETACLAAISWAHAMRSVM